ncbi:MAG: MFS transporter [Pseudomonadota bacterium]
MSLSTRLSPHHRIFAAFAVYAFALGQIFPRFPDLKAAMGVEEGAFGLSLMGTAVGTLIALTLSTAIAERIGHRIVLLGLIPLMSVFFAVASFATGPLGFFLLLIPAGLTVGTIEIIINVEADRVEAGLDRRIMNRAHAFWSFGFFGAGIFGAAMVQLGVSPQAQLISMMPLSCIAVWLFLADFQPAPKRSSDKEETPPIIARPTGAILVLVGVSLSAMLLEGAYIDWSAIYMTEVFETAASLGGIAVATAAVSQAIVRYYADGFVDKFAPTNVARFMQVAMAIGVVLVFVAPTPAISLIGFVFIGAGCSVMFPLAMSAAAQRTDRPAAINVAALAQFSFVTFLLAPPLLGYVAEHFGLRWTFGVGLPLIALSFALCGALGQSPEAKTKKAAS